MSDALWKSLAERWTDEQLIELVVLAGFYHCISFITNALAIECEALAPRFPPPRGSLA